MIMGMIELYICSVLLNAQHGYQKSISNSSSGDINTIVDLSNAGKDVLVLHVGGHQKTK